MRQKPLLAVDVDGVISLFGSPAPWAAAMPAGEETAAGEARTAGNGSAPSGGGSIDGSLHTIEGVPHFLSRQAAVHLIELAGDFELVWASGWEERADEHLPGLLGLPKGLPHLRFERAVGRGNAHWKLDAVERHAGARPLAWIDDALSEECHAWARERDARGSPTLLVQTAPERGLTASEAETLAAWARGLDREGERSRPAPLDARR